MRVVVLGLGHGARVAVRGEDHRVFADGAGRAVEVTGDEDAGGGFKGDVFNGVAVVRAAVADNGVEGRALRPRREAGGFLDAGAEVGGVGIPARAVGKLGESGVEGLVAVVAHMEPFGKPVKREMYWAERVFTSYCVHNLDTGCHMAIANNNTVVTNRRSVKHLRQIFGEILLLGFGSHCCCRIGELIWLEIAHENVDPQPYGIANGIHEDGQDDGQASDNCEQGNHSNIGVCQKNSNTHAE